MSDARSPLTVDVVVDQMSKAEQLLQEAVLRVNDLGASAAVASRASASVEAGGEALRIAAIELERSVAALDAARGALVEAMRTAQSFLEATDVSALRSSIETVGISVVDVQSRLARLEDQGIAAGTANSQSSDLVLARIDRVQELEAERDQLKARLDSVMRQIPGRVAKKIQ